MSESHVQDGTVVEKAGRDLLSAGRNLWLAGLGAVAQVEEGSRGLFGRLVERGLPMEERGRTVAAKAADRTTKTVQEIGQLVVDQVEFEAQGVVKRVGLMTRDDLKVFAARLETLSEKIDEYAAWSKAASRKAETKIAAKAPSARKPRQSKKTR
jgi:poly(hydroxyalkanoate) granule-associated protein